MPRKEVQESSMPGGRALLTIVAAISFFLYQYLIIHTAVTMDGACLYTFWLPYKDQWFSPLLDYRGTGCGARTMVVNGAFRSPQIGAHGQVAHRLLFNCGSGSLRVAVQSFGIVERHGLRARAGHNGGVPCRYVAPRSGPPVQRHLTWRLRRQLALPGTSGSLRAPKAP